MLLLLTLLLAPMAHARKSIESSSTPAPKIKEAPAVLAADPVLDNAVRELLSVNGSAAMAMQSLTAMIVQMKQVRPDIPAEFWDRFEKEVKAEELIDLLVPVYAKHFTLEEIRAQTAFYQSPLGQRVLAETPAITAESMVVGQQWGQDVAMRVIAGMP